MCYYDSQCEVRPNMVGRVFYKNFANSDEFEGPQTERNVYLFQFCPEFRKRDGIYPQPTCFFVVMQTST